jgi:hypothetical protein
MPGTNTLAYGGPIYKLQRKSSIVNMTTGTVFTTHHFLQLTKGSLSLSIILYLAEKVCLVQNTLAYWAHL